MTAFPGDVGTMQPQPATARPAVRALRASKIREVANAGMGRDDVCAFWFGEPDEVTPEFIRRAAIDALAAGDTFYAHNLGIPELRAAVADYRPGMSEAGRCSPPRCPGQWSPPGCRVP